MGVTKSTNVKPPRSVISPWRHFCDLGEGKEMLRDVYSLIILGTKKGEDYKTLLALTIVVVLVVGFASLAQATRCEWKNVSQYCDCKYDLFLDSHGDCVSLMNACKFGDKDIPMCICKGLADYWPDMLEAVWGNLGTCISTFRADK